MARKRRPLDAATKERLRQHAARRRRRTVLLKDISPDQILIFADKVKEEMTVRERVPWDDWQFCRVRYATTEQVAALRQVFPCVEMDGTFWDFRAREYVPCTRLYFEAAPVEALLKHLGVTEKDVKKYVTRRRWRKGYRPES
jgi:hypothetical protein